MNARANVRLTNFRFAFVIEQADALRISVVEFLRKEGWLVHGIRRAEDAFNILAHIPYELIVIDPELHGMSGLEFVRILHNSREEWRRIQVLVIRRSQTAASPTHVAECGAFPAGNQVGKTISFDSYQLPTAESLIHPEIRTS